MSLKKDETAAHCCDPALSVLVMIGVSKRLPPSVSLLAYCLPSAITQPRSQGPLSTSRKCPGYGWSLVRYFPEQIPAMSLKGGAGKLKFVSTELSY